MEKFTTITSIATPLNRANIDTDAIIPKQFLKSIHRSGFGDNLFDEWRYLEYGEIGMDNSLRPKNKDFVLNQQKYQGSKILLTRENFGCGSSREHAAWALSDYGFRVIIAPSFADIFYNNAFKNGILLITQEHTIVDKLFNIDHPLTIDLVKQLIITNNDKYAFTIDKDKKHRLLNGFDDVAVTLQYKDKIKSFEKQHIAKYPWI